MEREKRWPGPRGHPSAPRTSLSWTSPSPTSTPQFGTRTTAPPDLVPATPQAARRFVDENSLGVAKALAYVRGDITWPGAPDGPVSAGAADAAWLPIVGQAGLVVLTRDKRIRSRPLERQALLDHNVRAWFLTSGGSLTLFEQLRGWLR
jgi:PIN like domain